MPDIRLGTCSTDLLHFEFERLEDAIRLLLVNADESGSMQGRTDQNVLAFEAVSAVIGGRADIVILHGFASDSDYDVILSDTSSERLLAADRLSTVGGRSAMHRASSPEAVVALGRSVLAGHAARGSTNPRSHPAFLAKLGELLDALPGEVELVVLNSSDGGFDSGPKGALTVEIEAAMRLVTARCRCLLAANVLVGSAGSPEALGFFTGDTEKYDNRLLFSTLAAAPGVLLLRDFDGKSIALAEGSGEQLTVSPALPCWTVIEGDRLVSWHPEGALDLPEKVTVRKHLPKPGGRRMVMRAETVVHRREVTLERDGIDVFRLIARSLSDNPYLREHSRAALNQLIAPLEALLSTRTAVLAMITASPEAKTTLEGLRSRVEANTADIRAVLEQEGLTPRERASRINALNNARHLLKGELRTASEAIEQAALEQELGFYEAHPNHWLVWLQPAIDTLKDQLGLTQVDPGDKMSHLSTRIRTAKSTEDGKERSADRYLDRLLAESRSRRDRIGRKADPRDASPFEQPCVWTTECCPVSGQLLSEGLAAIPFVADRSDLTSGNIMAGGQNVDRMPVDVGPMFSLAAVRELMWGDLGQMASPYHTGLGWYNAAIPVLLGPASPDAMRELEKAIGWLATGTTAFAPQMAEAIPGALAALLGSPDDGPNRSPQVQALLRTSALLPHFRSYPYAAGTAAFDESSPKRPLGVVWADSLDTAAGSACLQSFGCITSLFARAVAAEHVEPSWVAEDLFSWGCRNIARGVLGTRSTDGRGGVEGIRRLAAALHCDVVLDGYVSEASPSPSVGTPAAEVTGVLDAAAIAWVLGGPWTGPHPLPASDFTDALNAHLSSLNGEEQARCIEDLDAIFLRFDAWRAQNIEGRPTAPMAQPEQRIRIHVGFDDLAALESLRPRRFSTPVPGFASPLAQLRRMTKAGETTWFPPGDAGILWNESAASLLEAHTALYPLRAWLRLADAELVGQPALAALRASEDVKPIPALPRLLPRLTELFGGMPQVLLLLRRSFAFVVANANGYADNQWATSPLRTADAEAVDAILGAQPVPSAAPRRYTAADRLALEVTADWPKMDGRGYLPKSRAIDLSGNLIRAPLPLSAAAADGPDEIVCQRACAAMLADLVASGSHISGGLHREARRLLGMQPVDLRTLDPAERDRLVLEDLVPLLAGRVRGDPEHPDFFPDCANVLYQMLALGIDTRTLRAEEPAELLAQEAQIIRSLAENSEEPAAG